MPPTSNVASSLQKSLIGLPTLPPTPLQLRSLRRIFLTFSASFLDPHCPPLSGKTGVMKRWEANRVIYGPYLRERFPRGTDTQTVGARPTQAGVPTQDGVLQILSRILPLFLVAGGTISLARSGTSKNLRLLLRPLPDGERRSDERRHLLASFPPPFIRYLHNLRSTWKYFVEQNGCLLPLRLTHHHIGPHGNVSVSLCSDLRHH